MNLKELNSFEDELIRRFTSNPVLSTIESMPEKKFEQILLQKRFHSLNFTLLYDLAIDGTHDMGTKEIARAILREEYPAKMQSHREDLVDDLRAIGIPKNKIINVNPTPTTASVISKLFEMLKILETQELYDIKALTILRFWGEVLVSEEYAFFVKRLEKLGLSKEKSRFYWPHYVHDKKKIALNDLKSAKRTHSDRMTQILQKRLDSEEKITLCARTEEKVIELKEEFYSQF